MSAAAFVTTIPYPGAPGSGQLAIMALPRDAGELAAAAAFGPALLVTLMTSEEARDKDLADDLAALADLAPDWHQAPIADYAVPDPAFEAGWPALAATVHRLLAAGERVLIHCHGGRGRSGLVAARLLIDRGMDAPAALATVRRARPGAVETLGQEADLTGYAAGQP